MIDWQVELITESDRWEPCYVGCSRAVREHMSILEQGEKMFASEPSTNSDSFLISRASRTRVVGSFASRADREARSRSRNSCSARRSPLGSHICNHPVGDYSHQGY